MDNKAVIAPSVSGLDAPFADPNVQLLRDSCPIRPIPYDRQEPAI